MRILTRRTAVFAILGTLLVLSAWVTAVAACFSCFVCSHMFAVAAVAVSAMALDKCMSPVTNWMNRPICR